MSLNSASSCRTVSVWPSEYVVVMILVPRGAVWSVVCLFLLVTASLLNDNVLAQEALDAFERAILACYKPGAGVAHYFDGATDNEATAALRTSYDVQRGCSRT